MAQVYADPDRLEEFARSLAAFSREVATIRESLRAGLKQLSTTWRDQEYERFVNGFVELDGSLGQLSKEIEEVHPKLREDAAYIREYLTRSR
jgi:uncharacterized protein YukE